MGFFNSKENQELKREIERLTADLSRANDALKENDEIVVPVECDCKERQTEYLKDIDEAQKALAKLRKEKAKAEEGLAKVELDKKMEIEDIKHMQKILTEKNELDVEKRIFEAEKKAEETNQRIRKEYSDKLEKELKAEREKMSLFMEQVMAALPNVNMKIKA